MQRRIEAIGCVLVAALALMSGCGGGGGSSATPPPSDTHAAYSQGQIIVQTQASADYRSITIGEGVSSSLTFTGFYRAWFNHVEYRPAPNWLCGRSASDSFSLITSREDGSGAGTILTVGYSGLLDSVDWPSWSPDGQRIAFANAGENVLVCNRDGSGLHKIASGTGFASIDGLSWASNGNIYYALEVDGQTDLYAVNPDAAYLNPYKITDDAAEDTSPDVSPDGRWIAWSRKPAQGSSFDIYVMRINGDVATDAQAIAASSDDETWPRWSPDSRYIAYIRDDKVYVVDTVTGQIRQLTNPSSGADRSCDWSADGRYVLFTRDTDLYKIPFDGSPGDEVLVRAGWGTQVSSAASHVSRFRTLIGPSGSDWEGEDPPFGRLRPGIIIVQSTNGYVSAVSFLINSSDTLLLADRTPAGASGIVVCEAKAAHLRRVLEDMGPGVPKNVWTFDNGSTIPGAVVIVFNARSGKVSSVAALWDQVGSSAAGGERISIEGNKLVIRAPAITLYDCRGRCVTGPSPVGRVVLDATTGEPLQ